MDRPLIGVTAPTTHIHGSPPGILHGDPLRAEITLGIPYTHAIEAAGGLPMVISQLEIENIDPLLDRVSGLLLTGGPDIDPSCYGAKPHSELGPTHLAMDTFEIALCQRADARGLPILGVCRGAEVLNVARGGTLHQHLPDFTDGKVQHRQTEPGNKTTHEASVLEGSQLAIIVGEGLIHINSFHHQAIDHIGRDLSPVAWAPDGIVEAVEDEGSHFVLGVQWHAETLVDDDFQLGLFRLLVEEARMAERRG